MGPRTSAEVRERLPRLASRGAGGAGVAPDRCALRLAWRGDRRLLAQGAACPARQSCFGYLAPCERYPPPRYGNPPPGNACSLGLRLKISHLLQRSERTSCSL